MHSPCVSRFLGLGAGAARLQRLLLALNFTGIRHLVGKKKMVALEEREFNFLFPSPSSSLAYLLLSSFSSGFLIIFFPLWEQVSTVCSIDTGHEDMIVSFFELLANIDSLHFSFFQDEERLIQLTMLHMFSMIPKWTTTGAVSPRARLMV